ncbi:MAG: hypothetical protein KGH63_01965, partial [Candidatus Micrarchaeota archaeon]|nr:hypothetical protein [Candidatus Micrarchaeota archaeon]
MTASAFAPLLLPAYLFAKPGRAPAIGAAVALQQGVRTAIHAGTLPASAYPALHPPASAAPAPRLSFRFNGQPDRPRWAQALLVHFSSRLDEVPLRIEQTTSLPDLGAPLSAARALSLSLALNAWCQTPYSPRACARLAQDALGKTSPPGGFGVHLQGGMLRLSGRSPPRVWPLSAAELRLPIRLSCFGSGERPAASKPKKSALLLSRRAALQANRLFAAHPSLLSLTTASHHFALQSHPPRFWAAD